MVRVRVTSLVWLIQFFFSLLFSYCYVNPEVMDGRNIEVRRNRALMDFPAHEIVVHAVAGGSDFEFQLGNCSLRLFLIVDFESLLVKSRVIVSYLWWIVIFLFCVCVTKQRCPMDRLLKLDWMEGRVCWTQCRLYILRVGLMLIVTLLRVSDI